ncbi:MAG: 2-succinyl-6-hydroxy-2,4-cyclohexadiene-carboxylate synthase [Solirubrobacteraceae bacterium]|nr:2-succinyl-6-hydroxy-2,4-cyclohexadiene-carboxylate synthase [Solirubrobacteraceae bacterium]
MRDLVLLHGFTQTGRSWAPVIAELRGRYRCFAPDLPGHGDAQGRRPATFDAVAAYLAALKLERFTLCGYSMGGRLALDFALRHPARVERLVLIGATPGIADAAERAERRRADLALADRIEAIGLEAFVDEWGAQPLFAGQPRGVAALAREDRLRSTASGLAAALRGMGTGAMTPLGDRLGELAMPVTWVVGEHDAKFRALAPPDAVVIPGAGHAAHLEAPEAVAGVLNSRH